MGPLLMVQHGQVRKEIEKTFKNSQFLCLFIYECGVFGRGASFEMLIA